MIQTIPTQQICAWEMNPRKRIENKALQPLIDSIRAVGWFGTILVRPLEDGRHQVIAGERRWRASMVVGLEAIECDVREMDDKAAIELAVIENRDREDLDVIEEAGAYKAMVGLGWTVKEIAARSGKSERSIYLMLELCDLADDVQDALRDRLISMNVATVLGRIEDDGLRSEALERITMPRVQDHPLSEKQALPLIQREYLEPQKRQAAWEKREKALRKEYGKDVEIISVQEAGKITGFSSGYVPCDSRPDSWELAVHARGREPEEIPTWGELAEKHGARRVAVPDADGDAVFYVESEPLITACLVAGEKDPEGCIFPLKGAGRHEQSLEEERNWEKEQKERKDAMAENIARQKALVKRLHTELVAVGDRKSDDTEEIVTLCAEALLREGQFEGFDAVAELLGVDLEALGDGDAVAGEAEWLARVFADGALTGAAFLLLAYHVANVWPGSDTADAVFSTVESAIGLPDTPEPVESVFQGEPESADEDDDEQSLRDAHGSGYDAFSEGKMVEENPFSMPAYRARWEDGWMLACVEAHPETDAMDVEEITAHLNAKAAGTKKAKK